MSFDDIKREIVTEGLVWLELPFHKPFDHHAFLAAIKLHEAQFGPVRPGRSPVRVAALAHHAPTDEEMMQLFVTSGWFLGRVEAVALVPASEAAWSQLERFFNATDFKNAFRLMGDRNEAIAWLSDPALPMPQMIDEDVDPEDSAIA